MKKYLAAVAFAAALYQPASAVTFPTLTTIYVGAGVRDNGGLSETGVATTVLCSNVSGVAATIRWLFLTSNGVVAGALEFPLAHGATATASTHGTTTFNETVIPTGAVTQGVVNVESTQSGVFCTATIINAAVDAEGIPLHLVRVNPHPGTVE